MGIGEQQELLEDGGAHRRGEPVELRAGAYAVVEISGDARFVQALERYDCVCGNRVATRGRGDNVLRVITSRVGNWVRNRLSGDQTSDSGCTFRAFRRECTANIVPFTGMHRFMPTLIKMEGYRVGEIAVVNQPRHAGRSHYGFWNRLVFLQDLLAVRWMKS